MEKRYKIKRILSAALSIMLLPIASIPLQNTSEQSASIVAHAASQEDVLREARNLAGHNYYGLCLQYVQDTFDNAGIPARRLYCAMDA